MHTLTLHADDDVLVALHDLEPGVRVDNGGLIARSDVPAGHKIACRPLASGALVRKYGQIIGVATRAIEAGEHVHSHNLGMAGFERDPAFGAAAHSLPRAEIPRMFQGYHRPSGRVGTRNYLGVLSTVNCSGSVANFIAEAFEREGGLARYPNVDGIVPIVHAGGCGMAWKGESFDTQLRTLTGYAANPNFGAILLVGLGCEVMQIPALTGGFAFKDAARFRTMTIQDSGGTRSSVHKGVALLHELAAEANKAVRAETPASALMLGMQCGGSDGYSGLTANPALGVASDLLVGQGGTSILSETPEIYGAEHLLTRRCVNEEVGRALLDRIAWWEDYCQRNFAELDNNPSPGNKKGGLTTILEKSLGAVAKAGTAPLSSVYLYGQPIDKPGLVFMDSPGYDPCSATGQIASGANLIAFATGRGSVSGFKPVPCIKLASNSDTCARLADDMDIDCGDVLRGTSLTEKGEEIFAHMLDVASGRRTKSEELGFGGVEFVPWLIGAVM